MDKAICTTEGYGSSRGTGPKNREDSANQGLRSHSSKYLASAAPVQGEAREVALFADINEKNSGSDSRQRLDLFLG